jgi:hypothetical protein
MWMSLSSIRSVPCGNQVVNQLHFADLLAHRFPSTLL